MHDKSILAINKSDLKIGNLESHDFKIDPLLIKEKEDQFIKKFLKFIENKNKQELLQIQKFINLKLNKF